MTQRMAVAGLLTALLAMAAGAGEAISPSSVAVALDTPVREDFTHGIPAGWQANEGKWTVRDGQATAEGGFATLLYRPRTYRDVELSADVAYAHNEAHAAAGLLFRMGDDSTGYLACVREIENGVHPEFGPWERPVLQLYRLDRDGWKLLQESKVMDCRSGRPGRIKVVCRGPNLWVFYQDMQMPVLREFDSTYDRPGWVGLVKDLAGRGLYDNIAIAPAVADPAPPPDRTDWSWVRGAVYVRSNAVNSVQMWHDYWDHTAILNRELSFARAYGFNMVQVYLHWIVWDRHREDYLRRIDDFLRRAAGHGLKVNFILWDDCGHVEPALTFAAPVPGRHNSQMMPNPSHRIRDSEARLTAHRERFRDYVQGVVGRFKDDPRIAFWQIYNECMGPKEQYRRREADANLNRLLEWTREWAKETGTKTPLTATGGGFYGPKYSDFYTYHSYRSGQSPLPGADGGPEHLCTETLNRPAAGLVECLKGLAGKQNGFVAWELMIGRDNCRFLWGHPDGPNEPAIPFHGVIYPDGHPWDVREIEAIMGEKAFAALRARVFEVEYFDGEFARSRKPSITPRIDFDLGDEPGYGSPDGSAGVGKDHFSIRWTGRLVAPATGAYTLFADSDGEFRLRVDGVSIIDKTQQGRSEAQGRLELKAGQSCAITAEYIHREGPASSHLAWSGPGFERRILLLDGR